MTKLIQIHPENPQDRLIKQVVDKVRAGGVIVYPTDSGYALGCHIGDKKALDRIRNIRKLDEKHNFTLVCRDLSELGVYAEVDNIAYRALKNHTPGPYTFILKASREVPRRLKQSKRKTIGLRVPDNVITKALLSSLGEPLMSVTLILPGDEIPLLDSYEINNLLSNKVDLIVDGGFCGTEPTTVIDLSESEPKILREGAGPIKDFRID